MSSEVLLRSSAFVATTLLPDQGVHMPPSTAILLLSRERGQVTTGASQVRRPPPHVSMRCRPDGKRGPPEVKRLCCNQPAPRPGCLSKGPSLCGHRHQVGSFYPLPGGCPWLAPSQFSMRGAPEVKRLCCNQLAPRPGCLSKCPSPWVRKQPVILIMHSLAVTLGPPLLGTISALNANPPEGKRLCCHQLAMMLLGNDRGR